jgi:hypothetical protein
VTLEALAKGELIDPSLGITPGVCETTVSGWVWYCDEHDSHGNADTEDEAVFMFDAHYDFHGHDEECSPIIFLKESDA